MLARVKSENLERWGENNYKSVRQTQMGSVTYLGAVESVTGVRSTSMPESKARLKSSDTSLRTLSA